MSHRHCNLCDGHHPDNLSCAAAGRIASLGQSISSAQTAMASWSPARIANCRLEGDGPTEPEAVEVNGWQPIATAPTEHHILIGKLVDGQFEWWKSSQEYERANEFAGETWSGWYWSDEFGAPDDCTHWRHVPEFTLPIESQK